MNQPAAAQPAAPIPAVTAVPAPGVLGSLERRVSRLQALIAAWRALCGVEFYLAGALLLLAALAFADQFAHFKQESLRTFAWCWWGAAGPAFAILGWLVWRHTPGRGLLALHLESRDRAYAGHLLTAIEALERPGDVPEAVAEISGEHAWRLLQQMPARTICPTLPWRNAHLGLLAALAVLGLGFGFFGGNYGRSVWDALFPGPSAATAAARLSFLEVRPGNAEIDEGTTLGLEVRCDERLLGRWSCRSVKGKRPRFPSRSCNRTASRRGEDAWTACAGLASTAWWPTPMPVRRDARRPR